MVDRGGLKWRPCFSPSSISFPSRNLFFSSSAIKDVYVCLVNEVVRNWIGDRRIDQGMREEMHSGKNEVNGKCLPGD